MSEYEIPLDDKIGATFDRVVQERGLGNADSPEEFTVEDLEAFIAADRRFLDEFIAMCLQGRKEDELVDPETGRYNDSCLQKFDRVLAKLGYAYDKASESYVQRNPADIVIQKLSRQGIETARALPIEDPTY